jgi:hypothetical protein
MATEKMKIIKAEVFVSHNRRADICQISIREIGEKFFSVVSDYAKPGKVIFKKCDSLLEAGMEFKAYASKVESRKYKRMAVDGTSFEFSADTFDFTSKSHLPI